MDSTNVASGLQLLIQDLQSSCGLLEAERCCWHCWGDAGEGSVSSAPLLPTPGIRARRDGVFAKRVGDSAGSPAAGSGLFCVRIPAQRVPVLPRGAATAAAGGLRASRSRRLGCCGST